MDAKTKKLRILKNYSKIDCYNKIFNKYHSRIKLLRIYQNIP